ncbi:hypothetical protein [Vibrio sp. 10N.239.312.D08]|uniref:hypothetical protein n=1 Tax=Vibrio sp. 10N.239.312.D08 TaxID=3229978 RepID=UPI00354FA0DA
MASSLKRVHRCIEGKKHQYYCRDEADVELLKLELAHRVDSMTFPWCINTIKHKSVKNNLPPSIHFKSTRKKLSDGSYSIYDKVILIIDRKSLGVYKTFSRRYGSTHTLEEAVDDVINRARAWWFNESGVCDRGRNISVSEL